MRRFRPFARSRRGVLGALPLAVALLAAPAARAALPEDPVVFPLHTASRTLYGANNAPFFIVGDAAWSLIVQLSDADIQRYLDDRKARGFNTVIVNLIEHKFATNAPNDLAGRPPFLTPGDFSTPNDAYFTHAEWVIQQAQARNLLVLLAPMYLGYEGSDQGWFNELVANGTAKAQAYGAYVGQRFAKYPNIVWVQGGDRAPGTAAEQVEAVVAGIRQYDGVHLHTAHSARGRSSLDDYDRPWLGLNAIYTDCDTAQSKARLESQRATAMPFFHIEGIYENETATNACLVGQMYYPATLGGRGHVFGNRPIWLFDTGWDSALGSTGAQYMQHAAELFRSRQGFGLIASAPSGGIVSSGAGTVDTADYVTLAQTANGASMLAFVPSPRTLQIDTSKLPGTSYVAWWFDVANGQVQKIGTIARAGNQSFTTPGGDPYVLVLDMENLSLRAPGVVPSPALGGTDFVWQSQVTGDLYAWLMNGAAQSEGVFLSPPRVPDTQWKIRGTADFDGDGKPDLLWHNLTTGDVYLWYMDGTRQRSGTFLSPGRVTDTQWQIAATADFNGDGKPDVLWHHQVTGGLYVWFMNGASLTGASYLSPAAVGSEWQVRGVADFNGDGKPDLLWHNQSTGGIYVWFMNGTSLSGGTYLNPSGVSPVWQIRKVADFDGDGKPDILWHNQSTGDLYVWIMNGTSLARGTYVAPGQVPSSWQIVK